MYLTFFFTEVKAYRIENLYIKKSMNFQMLQDLLKINRINKKS